MTPDQAAIAVPILNTYAHGYLGLPVSDVLVSGAELNGEWRLIVAIPTGVHWAVDLDHAKAIIDGVRANGSVSEASDGRSKSG